MSSRDGPALDRRTLLALLGTSSAAALAGCGGDDGNGGGDGNGDESPDAPPRATTEKSAAEPTPDRTVTRNTAPPSETAADNGVRCSHCGAANDSGYERCRRCTKRL